MTDAQVPENAGERVSECVSETHLNIYQRRNMAKRIVREASFSKVKSEGLQYAYVPVDQIKSIVEDAWNRAGIVMDILFEDSVNVQEPERTINRSGNTSTWYHKRMELGLALVNIDDPEDRYQCVIVGEARDNSDKVYNKLYTSAIKNFYKLEYNVAERKDDPDELQTDEMIEQANAKENAAVRLSIREQAKQDPFFSKPTKVEKPEPVKVETPTEVPEGAITADDAVTLDRPIEQIRQSLGFFMGDLSLSEIINPARQAWGSINKWTDDQCRQIYLRCVKAKRSETEVTE